MDLALLRTFVTVARTGSVTVAARELHLSQASVSRHLQRLESELGVALFRRRDGRRLELTDAGRRILEPGADLVATADERWRLLREMAAGRPQRLVVALGPMVTSMPESVETLRRFHAEHPGLDLRVAEEPSTELALRSLRSGEIDLAIRGLRDDDFAPDLEVHPIARFFPHVVLPRDHALADRATVGLADIAAEPFVFRQGGDARRDFLELCTAAGIEPNIVLDVDSAGAGILALTSGEAITVAWMSIGRAPGPLAHTFRMVPLDAPAPRATLAAYWLRARPPIPPAFDLVAAAQELARAWSRSEPIQH